MKIKDLKTFVVGNPPPHFGGRYFIFLKLITDDGIEGADYYQWQYNIYEPTLVAVNGKVQIPDAPGWGVEINPEFLEKTKHQISKV